MIDLRPPSARRGGDDARRAGSSAPPGTQLAASPMASPAATWSSRMTDLPIARPHYANPAAAGMTDRGTDAATASSPCVVVGEPCRNLEIAP